MVKEAFLRRETRMAVKGKHRIDTSKKRNCVEEPLKNGEVIKETIQNWRSIKIQRQKENGRLCNEQEKALLQRRMMEIQKEREIARLHINQMKDTVGLNNGREAEKEFYESIGVEWPDEFDQMYYRGFLLNL